MKLEVLVTYDDRIKPVGTNDVKFHRNGIGVEVGKTPLLPTYFQTLTNGIT